MWGQERAAMVHQRSKADTDGVSLGRIRAAEECLSGEEKRKEAELCRIKKGVQESGDESKGSI